MSVLPSGGDIRQLARQLWCDEDAFTTVEYALLLALLVVAGVVSLTDMGCKTQVTVQRAGRAIKRAGDTH